MAKLRLGIITDIHYGDHDGYGKLSTQMPRLMDRFARAVARFKPDAVIELGDKINRTGQQADRDSMRSCKAEFNKVAAPVYHLTGNHDVVFLSRAELSQITNAPATNYSIDIGGYHLVFFNPGEYAERQYLAVTQEDLDWLRDDLAATDKPCIILSHVPLDNLADAELHDEAYDGSEDWWGRAGYPRAGSAIRDILEQSGKVQLCLSGHTHRNSYREINGIHYITQQSLVSMSHEDRSVPNGTYSFIDLDDDEITVRLRGRDPVVINNNPERTYTLTPPGIA